MGCFDDRQKVVNVLKKLKEEDLGMSVVVTGLRDKVEDICHEVGLTPHSADLALGIFGDTSRLPDDETMCYTTMCGHAMISAGLVKQIRKAVVEGRMEPEKAGKDPGQTLLLRHLQHHPCREPAEAEKEREKGE